MPEVHLKVAMACGVRWRSAYSIHLHFNTSFHHLMTIQGCSGAVERVLKNTPGVNSVVTNLETQKVTVETDDSLSANDIKEIVSKTGKATSFW